MLKPGGFFLLTTCGMSTMKILSERAPARWSNDRIQKVSSSFVTEGFYFEEEYKAIENFKLDTKKYGMAYFNIFWLLEKTKNNWTISNYKTARSGHQDVFVLRKRELRIKKSEKIDVDFNKWKTIAQKGELAFHQRPNFRSSEKFVEGNSNQWKFWGYTEDRFENEHILDVGAGSRLRGKFFKNAKLYAIEPLGNEFLKTIDWCDLDDSNLYSVPAEEFIAGLVEVMDFVFSINVIDHCFNVEDIFRNCYKYLKQGGEAFFCFDLHEKIDNLHPVVLNKEICDRLISSAGFTITEIREFPSFHKSLGGVAVGYYCRKD